jgi:hypothetical protein
MKYIRSVVLSIALVLGLGLTASTASANAIEQVHSVAAINSEPSVGSLSTSISPSDHVDCTITAGDPYDRRLYGGTVQRVGPALIQCVPHAPHTSIAYTQMWYYYAPWREWVQVGEKEWYMKPTEYHHFYQIVSSCVKGQYKNYAYAKACYGTCDAGESWSRQVYIDCDV